MPMGPKFALADQVLERRDEFLALINVIEERIGNLTAFIARRKTGQDVL